MDTLGDSGDVPGSQIPITQWETWIMFPATGSSPSPVLAFVGIWKINHQTGDLPPLPAPTHLLFLSQIHT